MAGRTIHSVFLALLLSAAFLLPNPASAIDLDSAKRQGLVGETEEGYLAPVTAAAPEVQQLVSSVNAERRQRYVEIAQRNNTALTAVETLAGKKAIELTAAGQFVRRAGNWVRK